jgi:predicted nucleic acid-binding protein
VANPRVVARKSEATLRYIESSALVAALMEDDTTATRSIRSRGLRITSALTIAEASRAILRARAMARITLKQQQAALLALRRFSRRSHIIGVTDTILTLAARPFPIEPIRTLDAIHLASVASLGEPPALITIVTRDARIRENAVALSYAVE